MVLWYPLLPLQSGHLILKWNFSNQRTLLKSAWVSSCPFLPLQELNYVSLHHFRINYKHGETQHTFLKNTWTSETNYFPTIGNNTAAGRPLIKARELTESVKGRKGKILFLCGNVFIKCLLHISSLIFKGRGERFCTYRLSGLKW